MLDDFLENLFQETEEEPFQIDNALLDMGINEDQQKAIFEAKREVLQQYSAFKKNKNKNYLRIKKEVYSKINEIEEQKNLLEAQNAELKKEIQELQMKVNLSLSHRAGEGIINQLKESEKLVQILATKLYEVYLKSNKILDSDKKNEIKEELIRYIRYSEYYIK